MKHIKILITILFLLVLSISNVYAAQLSFGSGIYNVETTESGFNKEDEEGTLINDAVFDQVSLNNHVKIKSHHSTGIVKKSTSNAPIVRDSLTNYSYISGYSYSFAREPFFAEDREFISQSSVTVKVNGKNHKISLRNYKMEEENKTVIIADVLYDNRVIFYNLGYREVSEGSEYLDKVFTLSEDYFHIVKVNGKELLISESTEEGATLISVFDEDIIVFSAVFGTNKKITDLSGTNKNKFKNDNEYKLYNIEEDGIRFLLSDNCSVSKESITLQEYFFDFSDVKNMEETYTASSSEGNLYASCTNILYDNNYINIMDLLTPDQKQVYNEFKELDDIVDYSENFFDLESKCKGKEEYINSLKKSKGIYLIENTGNKTARIAFKTFMKIEETKTPKGFEKVTVMLPIVVYIEYHIESNGLLSQTRGYFEAEPYLLKYDSSINYEKIDEAYNAMDSSYLVEDGCIQNNKTFVYSCPEEPKVFDGCISNPILVDKTSKEDLNKKITIDSFVDGKERVNTIRNKNVTVSVRVENNAKTPAYTNTITVAIPKGIEVDNSSITRNGVYSSEKSTVEWNLDYLDAESVELFSFIINVPESSKDNIYSLKSNITNEEITSPIESQVVRVNLESSETNPKTGDIRQATLLFALTISVALLLFVVHKSTIRNI